MRFINLIKKCLLLKVIIFFSCVLSTVHAEEDGLASAYLCIDSEVVFPSEVLEEKVNLSKQLMANTKLLVTDGQLLFFGQLFRNRGLFFSPVIDDKSDQFKVLIFKNTNVAISIKNGDVVKNERYLCEFNRELSLLVKDFGADWPNRLVK